MELGARWSAVERVFEISSFLRARSARCSPAVEPSPVQPAVFEISFFFPNISARRGGDWSVEACGGARSPAEPGAQVDGAAGGRRAVGVSSGKVTLQ